MRQAQLQQSQFAIFAALVKSAANLIEPEDEAAVREICDALLTDQAIPIIVVTSYALSGDDVKAFEAGCDGYVTKPFSPRALLAKVREFLGSNEGE